MKKNKRLFYYVLYTILILVYLYMYRRLSLNFIVYNESPTILSNTDIKDFLLKHFMIILLGSIIALPQFVINLNKVGKIKFDWLVFIIVGIPALFISLGLTLDICKLGIKLNSMLSIFLAWLSYGLPRYFSNILFGYVFISCFSKDDANEKNKIYNNLK